MPARPLTTIVTLGALACAATVGLEAVGVLFPVEDTEPGPRIEAFMGGLQADTDSMVAPSRPVDLPDEATAREPVWYDAEPSPADPSASAGSVAADGAPVAAPEAEARTMAFLAMPVLPSLPPPSRADDEPSPIEILSPPWQPLARTAVEEAEPAVVAPAAHVTEPALPQRQRLARGDRPRFARANASIVGTTGCPFLDWLVP